MDDNTTPQNDDQLQQQNSAGVPPPDNANDQFLTNNPDDTNPMNDMAQSQKLPQDHDTPFSPPSGVQDRIGDTHQTTDSNIIEHEHYDEADPHSLFSSSL